MVLKMSDKKDKGVDNCDDIEFSWGIKKGRGIANKGVQFYESFRYDGVEYFRYDSVYLFKDGETEPYIGKLIKIWEGPKKEKKIKVLWFFRPVEISNYLKGVNVLENELFLACGGDTGCGLTNVNPLEAIAGKCNVICISKDDRNRQPSDEELKMADFVFYRTFDVQSLIISDKLDEKIALVDVKLLLNKNDSQRADLAKTENKVASVCVGEPISVDNTLVAAKTENKVASVCVGEPISVDNTLVADISAHDKAAVAPVIVESDKGVKTLLDQSKSHPLENGDTLGPDNFGMVASIERKLVSNEDTRVDGEVEHDAGLRPSMGKDLVLKSGQNSRLKSPDLKQSDLNKVQRSPVHVGAADKEKLSANDIDKRTVAGKLKSEDRPSKKLKLDGGSQITSSTGSAGAKKSAGVSLANKKASESGSAGCVAKSDEGKLARESGGISGGPPGNQKSDGIGEDKSTARLHKSSKDSDKTGVNVQHSADGAAKTNDRGLLSSNRDAASVGISKKRKINDVIEQKHIDKPRNGSVKDDDNKASRNKKVTQQALDTSKWFIDSPWEVKIKDASDENRLVLLQNLDPTYISSEVETIILHGFKRKCTAKVLQRTAVSNPHSGQAFAIFFNKEDAEYVISRLNEGCLMLPNKRPLVGIFGTGNLNGKPPQFFGHLAIEKLKKLQKQRESRDAAVSTSHPSQQNTLENDLALEWLLLQARSDGWWKKLYEIHAAQIRKVQSRLKLK